MGARPMSRIIQNALKAPLANEILFGKLQNGGTAHVDVDAKGEITIQCTPPPVRGEIEDRSDEKETVDSN
jgi:ATP-dependent Clp protease ATP-binding subunit ClpA